VSAWEGAVAIETDLTAPLSSTTIRAIFSPLGWAPAARTPADRRCHPRLCNDVTLCNALCRCHSLAAKPRVHTLCV
jgi:hypothetical protein